LELSRYSGHNSRKETAAAYLQNPSSRNFISSIHQCDLSWPSQPVAGGAGNQWSFSTNLLFFSRRLVSILAVVFYLSFVSVEMATSSTSVLWPFVRRLELLTDVNNGAGRSNFSRYSLSDLFRLLRPQ
jgi:hypothetical protein